MLIFLFKLIFSFIWQPVRSASNAEWSFDCLVSALQAVTACPLLSSRLYVPNKVYHVLSAPLEGSRYLPQHSSRSKQNIGSNRHGF